MEARITKFHTVPYTNEELASMPEEQQQSVRIARYEKVIDEVEIVKFSFETLDQLRNKLVDLCNKQSEVSFILYMNNALRDSYIFPEGYRQHGAINNTFSVNH